MTSEIGREYSWSGTAETGGESGEEGMRLDRYLCDVEELFPRSQLKQRNPRFFLNDREAKASSKVFSGDSISLIYEDKNDPSFEAEEINLDILYEDDRVIVLNKPQGMVVHPAAGNWHGTLMQGLLYHCRGMGERFGEDKERPGIVHRLDKETSGVLIAAKDPEAQQFLARQFAERSCEKSYIALVKGALEKSSGRLESMIVRDPRNRKRFIWHDTKGKHSITEFRRIRRGEEVSLVEFRLLTGRTHQIRVHALMMGHPIVGDSIYSRRSPLSADQGMMLHAKKLVIVLPGEDSPRTFTAPLPERFTAPIMHYWNISPSAVDPD
jgi:23S rRNA pseudouridine1911/1915/1917 synthase